MKSQTPDLRASWYTVVVLMLAYVSSFIDRQILSLLVGPMKRDMGLSDTEVSLLMGLSFALFYTLLGIPIGRLADRSNRRNIIVVGIVFWSLMTSLCGTVKTYAQFFLARIGVGVGEAALSPAAYSMLADLFPKDKLATAISVYSAGIYIGSGVAVLVGAGLVSISGETQTLTLPIVGTIFSWQLIFFYIGLPGVLLTLLVLTVKEPPRRGMLTSGSGQTQQLSVSEAFALIRQKGWAFWSVTLGITSLSIVAYAYSAWIPTFFVRTYGWTMGQAGLFYGLTVTFFSTAGILTGGRLADRLTRRGYVDGKLRVGVIAGACILACSAITLVESANLAAVLLIFPCFFAPFPLGASSAAIQEIMPNQARGFASAVYFFVLNLIALGLGPTLVALSTDYLFADEKALRYSIMLVTWIGSVGSVVCYASGRAAYIRAVQAKEARGVS